MPCIRVSVCIKASWSFRSLLTSSPPPPVPHLPTHQQHPSSLPPSHLHRHFHLHLLLLLFLFLCLPSFLLQLSFPLSFLTDPHLLPNKHSHTKKKKKSNLKKQKQNQQQQATTTTPFIMTSNYTSSHMFPSSTSDRLSYDLITPQYSPDTAIAITLRHFEKQSKQTAEREYDVEHGMLPPPPPDDDPTIDPKVRTIHKKKRKVRSAIVSRRKTAIYVQKLEEELDTRDSLNAKLAERLDRYRCSLHVIQSQIDALSNIGSQPSRLPPSHNPNTNPAPPPPAPTSALPPLLGQSCTFPYPSHAQPLHSSMSHPAPLVPPTSQAPPFEPSPVDSFYPSPSSMMAPSSHHHMTTPRTEPSVQVQPSVSTSQPSFFQGGPFPDDFFPLAGPTEVPADMPAVSLTKSLESTDFSECSDRQISPSLRPTAPPHAPPTDLSNLQPMLPSAAMDAALQQSHVAQDNHLWKPSPITLYRGESYLMSH